MIQLVYILFSYLSITFLKMSRMAENASQEVDKGKMQEIKISLKEILSELRYEGYDEKKIASLIHEIYQDLEG